MSTSSLSRSRVNRKPSFTSYDDVETFVAHSESILDYVREFSALLESGEGLSTATFDVDGPTVSGKTITDFLEGAVGVVTGGGGSVGPDPIYYRVAALDSDGNLLGNAVEVLMDNGLGLFTHVITWSAWTGAGTVSEYRVYIGATSGAYTAYISAGTATTLSNDGLQTEVAATPTFTWVDTPTSVTLTVKGNGEVKMTLVTTSGRTIVEKLRFEASDRPETSDYR